MHIPVITLALATLLTLVVAFTALWQQLPFILHGVVMNALCSPGNGQVVMPSCPGTVPVVSTREEKAANFDQLFMHPVNVSPRKATPVTVVETDMKATLMEWLQVPGQVFNSSRAGFLIVKEQAKKGRATLIAGLSIKIEGWKEFGEALLYSFVSFLGMLVGLLWLMFHLETWWCSR